MQALYYKVGGTEYHYDCPCGFNDYICSGPCCQGIGNNERPLKNCPNCKAVFRYVEYEEYYDMKKK